MKLNLLVLFSILIFTPVAFSDGNCVPEHKKHRTVTKIVIVTKTVRSSHTSLPPNEHNSFRDKEISEFCRLSKLKPINGTQNGNGVCSSTPQGEIPKAINMPSTIIIEPCNDAILKAHQNFTIKVKTNSLNLGNFADPETQYNIFSQTLDSNGHIRGHQHVTVQNLDKLDEPPDSTVFAFFKGLNDAGEKGVQSVVADKLPPGTYRICTMSASFSHQPLVMPIAKRGAQDDCIRVTLK